MHNSDITYKGLDVESKLIFASSCVESCARKLNVSPMNMYMRMKNVDLINGYILKHYDTIHTESRANVTDDIIGCLVKWESEKV